MVSLERQDSLEAIVDESRIKELQEEVVRIQGKTFTKWINVHLSEEGSGMVDLFVDIRDGVRLFRLLETLSGDSIGKPKLARSRFHMIDNVNTCLDYLRTKKHIRIESIGANDIVAGNERLILGLIWTVIKCFQLQGVVQSGDINDGGTEKDHLLIWCQKQLDGYSGIRVQDFSTSWRDGLAFNALIHKCRPDLVDMGSLKPDRHMENLSNAFDVAFKHLGIAKLLDPEDVDKDKPDEISIITYISLFYIAFANSVNNQQLRPARRQAESTGSRPTSLPAARPPTSPTTAKPQLPVVAPRQKSGVTSPTSPVFPRGFSNVDASPPLTPTRVSSSGRAEVEVPRGQPSAADGVTVLTGSERIVADLLESTRVMVYDNSQMEGAWECNYCSFVNVPFTQLCAICFQSKRVADQMSGKRLAAAPEVKNPAPATESSTATTTTTASGKGRTTSITVTRTTRSSVQDTTKQLLEETDSAEKQKLAVDRLGKLLTMIKQPPTPTAAPPAAALSTDCAAPAISDEEDSKSDSSESDNDSVITVESKN